MNFLPSTILFTSAGSSFTRKIDHNFKANNTTKGGIVILSPLTNRIVNNNLSIKLFYLIIFTQRNSLSHFKECVKSPIVIH